MIGQLAWYPAFPPTKMSNRALTGFESFAQHAAKTVPQQNSPWVDEHPHPNPVVAETLAS